VSALALARDLRWVARVARVMTRRSGRILSLTLALPLLLSAALAVHAQVRTSTNYATTVDEVYAGGTQSGSASFAQRGAIGQLLSGPLTSANYANVGGTQGALPVYYVGASPGTLSFGSLVVGTPSTGQSVTLRNLGNQPLVLNVALAGSNAGDFGPAACGGTLAVNTQCVSSVIFTPQGVGARSAALQVAATGLSNPPAVSLTGSGLQATPNVSVSVTPASPVFGQPATLRATVGGFNPSGSVQFRLNGVNFGSPAPVISGVATLVTSALPTGTSALSAAYSGDVNNTAVASAANPIIVASSAQVPMPGWALALLAAALVLVARRSGRA
jgi:hypothetical protein